MYLVVYGNEFGFEFDVSNPLHDTIKFIQSEEEATSKFDEFVKDQCFAAVMYEVTKEGLVPVKQYYCGE